MVDDVVFTAMLLFGGPFLLMSGLRIWKKKRLIEDTPSSKIRSAAMGMVEIRGVAQPRQLLQSPITNKDCCFWRFEVQEYRKQGKSSRWVTLATLQSPDPFYIQDETGRLLIDPNQAELHIPQDTLGLTDLPQPHANQALAGMGIQTVNWFGFSHRIRVLEQRIEDGWPVYVLGELAHQEDGAQLRRVRLQDYLRQAKKDPSVMKAADSNADGVIDVGEWDRAREKLEADFHQREAAAGKTRQPVDNNVIRCPADGTFVLAAGDEASLVQKLGWTGPSCIAGGIAMTVAGVLFTPDIPYAFLIACGIIGAGLVVSHLRKSKGAS